MPLWHGWTGCAQRTTAVMHSAMRPSTSVAQGCSGAIVGIDSNPPSLTLP